MQCERANKPKDDTWRLLYAGQKTHTSFGRFISSFLIRTNSSSEAKIASGNEPKNRSTRCAPGLRHPNPDNRKEARRKNESNGRRETKQLGVKNRRRHRRPSTQPKVLIGYGCVRFEARVRTVEQCRSKNRQTSQSASTEIGADGGMMMKKRSGQGGGEGAER